MTFTFRCDIYSPVFKIKTGGIRGMKKAIEVKGQIKLDKKDMKEIRAGSCAQYGVVCDQVFAKPKATMEFQAVDVATADKLWLG